MSLPEIRPVTQDKKRYLPLLLLGDEQESMIDRYLARGTLFALHAPDCRAVCVLTDEGEGVCEVKNLAVALAHRRKGYGRQLLEFAAARCAPRFHTLRLGTGESPATLPFYRRCGFEICGRIKDFFTQHYSAPIVEGGVQLRDMILLERPLYVVQTPRLALRVLRKDDADALHEILGDAAVMYAWGHGFSRDETTAWIATNQARYAAQGFGYWAAVERASGTLAGTVGVLWEDCRPVCPPAHGLGYILARRCWGRGLAAEGAHACARYAFDTLGAAQVVAEIRPENTASCRVAQGLGMAVLGTMEKLYGGKPLPHLVYAVQRDALRTPRVE